MSEIANLAILYSWGSLGRVEEMDYPRHAEEIWTKVAQPRLLDAAVLSFDAEEADSWFSPNRFYRAGPVHNRANPGETLCVLYKFQNGTTNHVIFDDILDKPLQLENRPEAEEGLTGDTEAIKFILADVSDIEKAR
ncbi:hypothetical protein Tco_0063975 [Tanacetum coccineum]